VATYIDAVKTTCDDTIIQSALRSLMAYGYFNTTDATSTISTPTPALSPLTVQECAHKFGNLASHMLGLSKYDSKKIQDRGAMRDGKHWAECLASIAYELHIKEKIPLIQTGGTKKAYQAMHDQITKMGEKAAACADADKALAYEIKIYQSLYSVVACLAFFNYSEYEAIVGELDVCYKKFYGKKSKKNVDEPNPGNVFIELCLELLSKPDQWIRKIVEQVFGEVCHRFNLEAIQGLIATATNMESSLDIKDDDEDDEDEEEDEWEDEEEDDESDEEEEVEVEVVEISAEAMDMEASDGESSMDDEQMLKMDHHLAKVFRIKKDQLDKKAFEKQDLSFKSRLFALLGIVAQRQADSMLAYEMILPLFNFINRRKEKLAQLQSQASSTLTTLFTRTKLIAKDTAHEEQLVEMLDKTLELATHAHTLPAIKLHGHAAFVLLRSLQASLIGYG
jgi:hypothetical protein